MTKVGVSACPRVALIRGDRIGPEIADAPVLTLDAAEAQIEWLPVVAGMSAMASHGDPLPQETLDTLTACGLALKAPLGTPLGGGFKSITGLAFPACMLLDHFGQDAAATRVRAGLASALGNLESRTGDLGGKANTQQFTDAVIKAMD